MTTAWLLSFLLFATVTSISPGPNNFMLTASGLNFGFLRSIGHMVGIMIGFPIMLLVIGAGAGFLFQELGWLKLAMQWLGVVYFLWFSVKIALAPVDEAPPEPVAGADQDAGLSTARSKLGKPLNIWQAATFQWINVKAWIMAISAVTVYWTTSLALQIGLMALLFAVVGFASNALWTLFGVGIGKLLRTPQSRRAFNISMAVLVLLSLVPILLEDSGVASAAS